MCGRFSLTADQETLAAALGLPVLLEDHRPRYNVAPTDEALVLLQERGDPPRIVRQRWGFEVPPRPGGRPALLVNARSESVADRPAFRGAWRARRRCLVLADGFYEWSGERGTPGGRIPHWIHLAGRRPFGFAALFEPAPGPSGGDRFTILATEPNALVARIHDRMPVILATRSAQREWVDPELPPERVTRLLAPLSDGELREYVVSTWVNDPRHEGPACIEPVEAGHDAPPGS